MLYADLDKQCQMIGKTLFPYVFLKEFSEESPSELVNWVKQKTS